MTRFFKHGEREVTTVAIDNYDASENYDDIIIPDTISIPDIELKENSKIMWLLAGILTILAIHFIISMYQKFQLWRNTRFLVGRDRVGKIV
jgi:hypothetical protein